MRWALKTLMELAKQDLLEEFQPFFSSITTVKVFTYLTNNEGVSASQIMKQTKMPESSVYRGLNKLSELKLIKKEGTKNSRPQGGPKAIIWGIKRR